jgi:hypothetical protein
MTVLSDRAKIRKLSGWSSHKNRSGGVVLAGCELEIAHCFR